MGYSLLLLSVINVIYLLYFYNIKHFVLRVNYSNRHKRSNDSVKRNLSSENWSDRGKSGEDKKTVKRKTKSNRTENRRLRWVVDRPCNVCRHCLHIIIYYKTHIHIICILFYDNEWWIVFRSCRFQNKTVSDQGHYESAHDEENVSNFASLPSLLFIDNRGAVPAAEIAITNNKCKFTTARFQKRVIASD